jgi:seryl-tRNA synthetase
MIDITILRENPQIIKEMLKKRHIEFSLEDVIDLDREKRELITKVQDLKRVRNIISRDIADRKKENLDSTEKIREMSKTSQDIAVYDVEIRGVNDRLHNLLREIPNIPHQSVPEGLNDSDNVELRRFSKPIHFDFNPQDHIDIAVNLGIIDIERASKVAGARFYYLKGDLVRLNYALINFALDLAVEQGATLIQPPFMLNKKSIEGSIILSDFKEVIYKIEDEDLYLIATSEHAIAAMHMNEVLNGSDLPIHYVGISPCFRKEAGSHGRDTKGIFRVHQFEKVEQFVFSKPDDSWKELENMINNAEDLFKQLNIPYRIVSLCGAELGKVSAKTYDLEAWFPGQHSYREVISCSNCTDYQARGLSTKYRGKPHESSEFVHTLNSTLVATERTLIAIIENYQRNDGSIVVPKVLQPYMNGLEYIKA